MLNQLVSSFINLQVGAFASLIIRNSLQVVLASKNGSPVHALAVVRLTNLLMAAMPVVSTNIGITTNVPASVQMNQKVDADRIKHGTLILVYVIAMLSRQQLDVLKVLPGIVTCVFATSVMSAELSQL
jgi:hypothetical protein